MKELTIEEKARAYDKVSKEVKDFFEGKQKMYSDVNQTLEYLFPELKESEDERIRKALPEYFGEECDTATINGIYCYKIYAWLEKQGERKPIDKVEPKFKIGDFIVNDYCMGKVIELTNDAYLLDTEQGIPFSCEHNAHLWTIADAKDGDVLAYITDEEDLWIMIYWSLYEPYEGHVHYHALLVNDNFSDKGTCCICINDLKPATKEQRELLFQKMHEAGYEWDAENKELKKVEDENYDGEDYGSALLIYGVGGTIDYLKTSDKAKQLPDKAIIALDKYLENINKEKNEKEKD